MEDCGELQVYRSDSQDSTLSASRTPRAFTSFKSSQKKVAAPSASRRLISRMRRSVSQPSLAATPTRSETPRQRTPKKSSGRTPRATAHIERKRHKRQCSSPDRTLTHSPELSLRYNPITHQTKTYDCSPSPMPSDPLFSADEYRDTASPGSMVKARSVNSLLYGSPRRAAHQTASPAARIFDDDGSPIVANGSGQNATSTPVSSALASLTSGVTPDAVSRKPQASQSDSPLLASPCKADALFARIAPPKAVPSPPPRSAGALFQVESTRL